MELKDIDVTQGEPGLLQHLGSGIGGAEGRKTHKSFIPSSLLPVSTIPLSPVSSFSLGSWPSSAHPSPREAQPLELFSSAWDVPALPSCSLTPRKGLKRCPIFPKTPRGKRRLLREQGLWGDAPISTYPSSSWSLGSWDTYTKSLCRKRAVSARERRRKQEQRPLEQPLLPQVSLWFVSHGQGLLLRHDQHRRRSVGLERAGTIG